MKLNQFYLLITLAIFTLVTSCGTSNKVTSYQKKTSPKVYSSSNTVKKTESPTLVSKNTNFTSRDSENLLKVAKSFIGVPYKFGGTNESGFDCSGLVLVSFDQLGMKVPRNSSQQAEAGKEIDIIEARKGDLVFFNTTGKSISHVGIVEKIERTGEIFFIHSSTSKGVMISSLEENYWKARFVKAVRLL